MHELIRLLVFVSIFSGMLDLTSVFATSGEKHVFAKGRRLSVES